MSTTVIRAIRASQADVVAGALEPWGQRPGAASGAEMRGRTLLDQADRPRVGIWDCTPGTWTVTDKEETEVSIIVDGRARLTDADGATCEIGPGDVLVVPLGWSGTWEILETLRKVYVAAR